jgi:GFO/IDH/MocA oxidoreductase family protein
MKSASALPIALVGAGRRFDSHYADLLSFFQDSGVVRIVGVFNRGISRRNEAAKRLGCRAFDSLDDLLSSDAQAVIDVIKGPVKSEYAIQSLKAGKHLFLETPCADTVRMASAIRKLAREQNVVVEVAEDSVCTPEVLKQIDAITAGAIGKPIAVFNDAAAYAYHATARFGMLLNPDVSASWVRCIRTKVSDAYGIETAWISLRDGTLFMQRFPIPKDHASRKNGSWTIVGDAGVLGGDIPGVDTSHDALKRLLSDFFGAIRGEGTPCYGIERAVRDMTLWRAVRVAGALRVPYRIPAWIVLLLERLLP